MESDLPGVGVFGVGGHASLLVKILRSQGFTVAAIWSPTLDGAMDVGSALDVPFATNKVDDVLLHRNVGLVVVLCQPDLHAQIAVKALGIGKHVLCDIPVALNQSQVIKMVHAAQYYPSLISILGYGLRFIPAFQQLKDSISSGYVGDVSVCDISILYNDSEWRDEDVESCSYSTQQGYDWSCSKLMGGGVLSCVGSHVIDILSFLLSETAIRAHGITRTCTRTTSAVQGIRRIDSDHFCCFQLQMTGGVIANVTLNSYVPGPYQQQVVVCGSKGRLTLRGSGLSGQLIGDKEESVITPVMVDVPHGAQGSQQAGFTGLVKSLKAAFSSGKEVSDRPVEGAATFEDGQYVQAVLDAIRLSSATRHWEQVFLIQDDSDSTSR